MNLIELVIRGRDVRLLFGLAALIATLIPPNPCFVGYKFFTYVAMPGWAATVTPLSSS